MSDDLFLRIPGWRLSSLVPCCLDDPIWVLEFVSVNLLWYLSEKNEAHACFMFDQKQCVFHVFCLVCVGADIFSDAI
jgi:hypothetical protein